MKRLSFSILCQLIFVVLVEAQTDTIRYFQSYFETSADRAQWTNEPSDPNKNWIFNSKGGYIDEGLNYNPDAAYQGTYNAFHIWSDFQDDVRKIVTIPIDLSDSKRPELSFAHAMYRSIAGNNTLKVLFKAGTSAPWDTIVVYSAGIDEWTIHTINIKDYGTKYLCKNFQLAFLSMAHGEFGVCIDKVRIEERDIIKRYVKSFSVKHVPQSPIPSGASDIPVMRIDIQVVGNTDPLLLNSMVIHSLSSNDSLFASSGFELVATHDSSYRTVSKGVSLRIGSPVSISNGTVNFSGLNYNLSTGYNAIWVIADIKKTAPHNSIADFKINAGNVSVGTGTYPAANESPSGVNMIEQSVFFDSFEGTTAWTLESDFEAAVPKGYSAFITKDPDYAYSGTKVMGTDLTVDGKYRFNITQANAYYATTPAINLQYYTGVKLSFKKWIAFEGNDHGVIEVSNDNGATWNVIWDSKTDALTPDNDWTGYVNSEAFNALAAHKPAVKIRFGVIYSDANFAYAGFNIDNFAVTGNYLTNDLGITAIEAPVDDCHNPGMDSVIVEVQNYADRASGTNIPVFFSIDGSESKRVTEYIPGPVPKDGTIRYKFAHTANFPNPGSYSSFVVKVQAPGDQDASNDLKNASVFIQKSVTPPEYETFETGGGYWKSYGSDPRWLCKVPEGSIPAEYNKSWISSPYGNYLTSDTAYLQSSCYNLISNDQMIMEFKLWMDSESEKDGASVEYSSDGISWNLLPAHAYPWKWNWYDGDVTALGTKGWSGINSQGWKTVKQVIPSSLLEEPKVRFRIKWASDEENTFRGMALDEFRIYAAPTDIGISVIDSFGNKCQGINPDKVMVLIQNKGINALKQNDQIIVGFDFQGRHLETDTFRLNADLLPGYAVKHTFSNEVDVTEPGNYNITAYTLSEANPWFYLTNNDTLSLDFTVFPAPFTSLTDTIQTHLPDTVILKTVYNADYDYWWNGASGTNTYHVSDDGWQHLKVTASRGNGCSAYDSTNVELLFYDVGAMSFIHPADNCGFTKHEYAVVQVKNYGTDSIAAGQKITVSFRMNSEPVVSDTLKLEQTLHSGKAVDFRFTKGPVDLSEKGDYSFTAYTTYGGDTITLNDTVTKTVAILGRPVVSLGPDLTVVALSHTFDAGAGFTGYSWDNGTTLQTRQVTESGSYWVRVTDENLCDNSDTAYVRLKIRDVRPDGFTSPVSDCHFATNVPVTMRYINSGTDTVPSGSKIIVSYCFNGGSRVADTVTLSSQLIPGASGAFAFEGGVDLNTTGDFDFQASTVTTGDLRSNNDTLETTVYRYNRPVVDFGLASTEYIEDISIDLEAGVSPYYSYQWQDTVTTHNYHVVKDGLYWVKATDNRTMCYDRDSVRIFLIYGDVGVTWTDMPAEGCTGDFSQVKVKITNLGPSSIGSNAPIYVACDINGTRALIDTLTRSGSFNPGAVLQLQLTETISVGQQGSSTIAFYTLFGEDKKHENDTLVMTFDALPAPVIDFGEENGNLTVGSFPYVLDAGAGNKAYLWQDNSAEQTFEVNAIGSYTVTVTALNDCQATKTVQVKLQSPVNGQEADAGFIVYPNPGDGLFRIKMDNAGECTVRVYSNQGELVYIKEFSEEDRDHEMDVRHLARGIYHLVIQSGGGMFTGKIVIQ
ncbi:MAG TPA: T9SS type A sorting domain-containing protein [Bacteroidales bacterium]|nr:T9SS type A sorting domain-containing protein [Bacteroidales bacterium]